MMLNNNNRNLVQQLPPNQPLLRISEKLSENDALTRYFPKGPQQQQQQQQQQQNNNNNYNSLVVIDDNLTTRFPNHSVVAVRDQRFTSTYYYAAVFNVAQDLSPPQSFKRKQIAACLRNLKYQSNARMVIAWHESLSNQPATTTTLQTNNNNNNNNNNATNVPEEIFSMLNEECVAEQVPLIWASSSREAVSLILSLSRPTGIRSQRISSFGKSAQSVNAKMAALLLHSMSTQMMSEGEAVRAVDAFAIQFPGSTPADLILFLSGVASERIQGVLQKVSVSKSDQMVFLQKSVLLTKPRAERVLSVFQADFIPGVETTSTLEVPKINQVGVGGNFEQQQKQKTILQTSSHNNFMMMLNQEDDVPPPSVTANSTHEQRLSMDEKAIRDFVEKNVKSSDQQVVVSTQMKLALAKDKDNDDDEDDARENDDDDLMLNFQ